jgi:hypothetical protein
MTDSIDFIRWKLTITDKQYTLHGNFGIGKPNTNGFYGGGKILELNGTLTKAKNIYNLSNGGKTLGLAELNVNLLHILDDANQLLVGNGGWSYTLNNVSAMTTSLVNWVAPPSVLKDSMAFEGRTPCGVPGIMEPGRPCYKLKWLLVLYANPVENKPSTYKIYGTAWRKERFKKGTWKILTVPGDRTTYQLNDEKGSTFINLIKLDKNILVFTDAAGNLLVGDLDFSYTLNGRR